MVHIARKDFARIVRQTIEHISILLMSRYGLFSHTRLEDVPTKMAVSCAASLIVMYCMEGSTESDMSMLLVQFTAGMLMYLLLKIMSTFLSRSSSSVPAS
jgi:hypothetical protein